MRLGRGITMTSRAVAQARTYNAAGGNGTVGDGGWGAGSGNSKIARSESAVLPCALALSSIEARSALCPGFLGLSAQSFVDAKEVITGNCQQQHGTVCCCSWRFHFRQNASAKLEYDI